MKTNPNHPANVINKETTISQMGLTKREHFASMAMQGILAQNSAVSYTSTQIAIRAVEQADALIEALNNPKTK